MMLSVCFMLKCEEQIIFKQTFYYVKHAHLRDRGIFEHEDTLLGQTQKAGRETESQFHQCLMRSF